MALDLMNRVFKKGHKIIRRTEKQVLRYLVQKGSKEANGLITNIYPSMQTIADYCDITEKSVRTAVNNLTKERLLIFDAYRAKGVKCYVADWLRIEEFLECQHDNRSVTISDLKETRSETIADLEHGRSVIKVVSSEIASVRSVTITDNPSDPFLNNLTIDLSSKIDDRKDNLVQLVDNKIKTEEELAREWLAKQLSELREQDKIPLHIAHAKDNTILVAEGMFHAIHRDQTKFPRMSNALKGMLSMIEQGIWHTPAGMLKKTIEVTRELRAYDKEPRPESIVDINYKRPEEEKVSGLKNLEEILIGLRKKGGGLAAFTH